MNLLDSSGWLEFFADGPLADRFAPVLKAPSRLLVPTVVVYEVFKVVLRERNETEGYGKNSSVRWVRDIVSVDAVEFEDAP